VVLVEAAITVANLDTCPVTVLRQGCSAAVAAVVVVVEEAHATTVERQDISRVNVPTE